MAAQAATKQKEAEALLQAKIDAEVEKRTLGLMIIVFPPPSPAKPKTKTAKTADVAPDDDGVSRASGASKGANPAWAPEETC